MAGGLDSFHELSRRLSDKGTHLKISARNAIKGRVVGIEKGAVAPQVQVDIGGGNVITSMITADAADELGLA